MEEKKGIPFIHKAGMLLRNTIEKILQDNQEFKKLNIMITNACKCKPTDSNGNIRAPSPEEIECCRGNLIKDLSLANPLIIVALGKTASVALEVATVEQRLGELRGKIYDTRFGKVLVTYHPSAILRRNYQNLEVFQHDILKAFQLAYLSLNRNINRPKDNKDCVQMTLFPKIGI